MVLLTIQGYRSVLLQGKVRIGSKMAPSAEVKHLLAKRWLDVCLPATGFRTYEEMRQAVNTERKSQGTPSQGTRGSERVSEA